MVPVQDDAEVPKWVQLQEWFTGRVGTALLALEREHLGSILPDLFGYHIVQVGMLNGADLLTSSRISHRVALDLTTVGQAPCAAVCSAAALPIVSQGVDVVLLPHVLEFEEDPHIVLREAERVLIGEGHVVIVGFNPWSLWGAWRIFTAWRQRAPWAGRFLGIERIKDWLHLLGFDILDTQHFYFRPPVGSLWLHRRTAFLERLGGFLCPFFSGTYIVLARKRLVTLTSVGMPARPRKVALDGAVGQPTCRVADE